MTELKWCPKCRQSFFEPGLNHKVYLCTDMTVHPETITTGVTKVDLKGIVLKKMRKP